MDIVEGHAGLASKIVEHLLSIATGAESDEWLAPLVAVRAALAEGRFVDAVRANWQRVEFEHGPVWVASRDVHNKLTAALGNLAYEISLPNPGRTAIRLDDLPGSVWERGTVKKESLQSNRETFRALYHDPMAEDPRYAEAVAAASAQAERELERHPLNGGLGFCRVFWLRKKQILWQRYGIEWLSPADRHPYVLFE